MTLVFLNIHQASVRNTYAAPELASSVASGVRPKDFQLELEINEGLYLEAGHFFDAQTKRQEGKGPCRNRHRNEKLHQALIHSMGHKMSQSGGRHHGQHQCGQVGRGKAPLELVLEYIPSVPPQLRPEACEKVYGFRLTGTLLLPLRHISGMTGSFGPRPRMGCPL